MLTALVFKESGHCIAGTAHTTPTADHIKGLPVASSKNVGLEGCRSCRSSPYASLSWEQGIMAAGLLCMTSNLSLLRSTVSGWRLDVEEETTVRWVLSLLDLGEDKAFPWMRSPHLHTLPRTRAAVGNFWVVD